MSGSAATSWISKPGGRRNSLRSSSSVRCGVEATLGSGLGWEEATAAKKASTKAVTQRVTERIMSSESKNQRRVDELRIEDRGGTIKEKERRCSASASSCC